MKPFSPKPRPCRVCEKGFVPRSSMQVVCSPRCAAKKVKQDKVAERAKVKTRKEALKGLPELIAEAQQAFNAWIRFRDAGLPCICCGKPFEPDRPGGSVDAGHFRSRSTAPHLRFDEDNCFAQRKNCNRPGGTTYDAFRAGVLARIGPERLAAVETARDGRKWTRDELREIRDHYRQKLKTEKAARGQ